jgi:hypothetical protein
VLSCLVLGDACGASNAHDWDGTDLLLQTGGSDDSDDIESSSEEEEDTGNARELESENEQRRSPSVDVASDDASRPRRRRTVRNGKIVELDDNDEIMEDI